LQQCSCRLRQRDPDKDVRPVRHAIGPSDAAQEANAVFRTLSAELAWVIPLPAAGSNSAFRGLAVRKPSLRESTATEQLIGNLLGAIDKQSENA
ncbi:hypothetical protein NPN19_24065, partial [Vibrio parahaemolyticus]|uniref:hypothetical protein n=1 Tax=Vibrio parahaemolyticus TaxID=670 RepID=UPI002111494A